MAPWRSRSCALWRHTVGPPWRISSLCRYLKIGSRSFQSGAEIYHRYGHLVDDHTLPFVRTSGGDRVVKSAVNWTAGKHAVAP